VVCLIVFSGLNCGLTVFPIGASHVCQTAVYLISKVASRDMWRIAKELNG
jgi:hypothetical protein